MISSEMEEERSQSLDEKKEEYEWSQNEERGRKRARHMTCEELMYVSLVYVENFDVYHLAVDGLSRNGLMTKKKLLEKMSLELASMGYKRDVNQINHRIKDTIRMAKAAMADSSRYANSPAPPYVQILIDRLGDKLKPNRPSISATTSESKSIEEQRVKSLQQLLDVPQTSLKRIFKEEEKDSDQQPSPKMIALNGKEADRGAEQREEEMHQKKLRLLEQQMLSEEIRQQNLRMENQLLFQQLRFWETVNERAES